MYAIVYRWPDGRDEVRYRRPVSDLKLAIECHNRARFLRARGEKSVYRIERRREYLR